MSSMKYIILKDYSPIIFSQAISHLEMSNNFGGKENVSAGEVSIYGSESEGDFQVSAYGSSFTLKIPSLHDDARIIKSQLDPYR